MNRVTFQQTLNDIRADAACYRSWRFQSGFWVTLSYRTRRLRKFGAGLAPLLLPLDVILGAIRWVVSDTRLPSACPIGPGLCMPHANGVIINERVRMGSNVRIFQHVTIGEWRGGAPSIGDGCSLYGGAKIFGPIEIGVHARIGPNCVVSDDVPAYHNVYLQPPLMVDRIGASKTAGSRGSIEPRGDE